MDKSEIVNALAERIRNMRPKSRLKPEEVDIAAALLAHQVDYREISRAELPLALADYERRSPRSFAPEGLLEYLPEQKRKKPGPKPKLKPKLKPKFGSPAYYLDATPTITE